MLEDMAVLTGAQVISEDAGFKLDSTRLDQLGKARRVTVTKDTTTIVAEGNEAKVKARCEQIRRQIEETESSFDKEKLQERLAKLAGGVAVIKVGAATETEMKDKKLRPKTPLMPPKPLWKKVLSLVVALPMPTSPLNWKLGRRLTSALKNSRAP